MNFITQEEITLDVQNPIGFCSDIEGNLIDLINRNYCGKFIGNRYYVQVKELIGHTDVFIQTNNSGFGSITCVVKFLCIIYSSNTLVFNLKLQGTDTVKNITIGKYKSERYPKLEFIIPSLSKLDDVVKVANVVIFSINKTSQNIMQADLVNMIYPIMLPFDLTRELEGSTSNKAFINLLKKDKEFDELFYENPEVKSGEFYVYEKGLVYKSEMLPKYYQNLTNISDRELCFDTLEKIIYNFIQYY